MLNPFLLYVTYAWGQADIIAGSFTMVAIYAAKVGLSTERLDYSILSCLALGLAASFKLFALALLPIFAFFLSRQSIKRWLLEILAGLSPLLLVVPFLSKPFLDMMQFYSQYMLSRTLSIAPWFTIYLIPALYLVLIYHVYFDVETRDFDKLVVTGLTVFSFLYGLAVWLPNWILWGTPFILLAMFARPKLLWIYAAIVGFYFLFVQNWGNSLWLGLFFPLTDATSGSGPIMTLPMISKLIPPLGQMLVGSSYTVIGVSVFFITYVMWRHRRTACSAHRALFWTALLLIPLLMGTVNLVLGVAHFQTYSVLILNTFTTRVSADLQFFVPYFALVVGTCAWFVISLTKSRANYPGGEGVVVVNES